MSQELGRNIYTAILKSAKELARFRPNPERGLELLMPYFNINSIDGLEKQGSDTLLGILAAAVADCYRTKGDFVTAAQWYKRASTFRVNCGFSNLYADMVIKHQLSDCYEHALLCIEESRKSWKTNPINKRIYYWLVSLYRHLKHPWDIPGSVSLAL